jgi:hypothetical protein
MGKIWAFIPGVGFIVAGSDFDIRLLNKAALSGLKLIRYSSADEMGWVRGC